MHKDGASRLDFQSIKKGKLFNIKTKNNTREERRPFEQIQEIRVWTTERVSLRNNCSSVKNCIKMWLAEIRSIFSNFRTTVNTVCWPSSINCCSGMS